MEQVPTVWVVDDSPLELAVSRRALESAYRVDGFADGASMLEALASRKPPDVLVLDWEMPGLTGLEVCGYLRANEATRELAVVILTGHGETEDLVVALGAGANDFVAKPFLPAELSARVAALVRAKLLRERAMVAEAALREVFEHLPEALVAVDAGGRIAYANPEGERMLGAAAGGLDGRAFGEVMPALAGQPLVESAAPFFLPDVELAGRTYAPLARTLPLGGQPATAISFRDVTEERRKELRRLDFYSMVAHDLRSPLGAVMMRADLLMRGTRGPIAPAVGAELAKMRGRLAEMVTLINDFLDLARADGTGFAIERTTVDATALVRHALDDVVLAVAERKVDLRFSPPEAGVAILGDKRRLAQVVTNLLVNAVHFTPPGGRIEVRVAPEGAEVRVSVIDSGPGISADVQKILFRRYERGAAPSSTQGSGLGLLIVREIVEAHGGSVGVQSEPGHGSTFWFCVPAAAPPTAAGPEVRA